MKKAKHCQPRLTPEFSAKGQVLNRGVVLPLVSSPTDVFLVQKLKKNKDSTGI